MVGMLDSHMGEDFNSISRRPSLLILYLQASGFVIHYCEGEGYMIYVIYEKKLVKKVDILTSSTYVYGKLSGR